MSNTPTECDLSQTVFLHTQCTSFDSFRAKIMCVGFQDCGEFGKNTVLKSQRIYVEQNDEIITNLPADVVARNKIDREAYKGEAVSPKYASETIREVIEDRIVVSFDSPSSLDRVFNADDMAVAEYRECPVIDLTYIITNMFNVPSDRWSPQGYTVPPRSDPLFVETCFYNFVPDHLIPREDGQYQSLTVERMGAMILEQLVKTVSLKRMVMQTRIHEEENADFQMMIRS